jgi:hypothetical protein
MRREAEAMKTADGERFDPKTGEIFEYETGGAAGRPKRRLTAEEKAIRDERHARKGAMLRALEALTPALVHESDPALRDARELIDVSRARSAKPLLELPRLSGRGFPGSALVLSAREYDGANGGEDHGPYVLACATYHDGASFKCRTRGVAIRREELRPVAAMLARYADELDGIDAGRK